MHVAQKPGHPAASEAMQHGSFFESLPYQVSQAHAFRVACNKLKGVYTDEGYGLAMTSSSWTDNHHRCQDGLRFAHDSPAAAEHYATV